MTTKAVIKPNSQASVSPKAKDMDHQIDMEADVDGEPTQPTHLVVTVNGLVGSAQNWKFAAEQFVKMYPRDVIVHCSECNPSMLTFDGVDVMGNRLAEEVVSVIKRYPGVQKISFIGHSMGGLVARYAVARLYEQDPTKPLAQGNEEREIDGKTKHDLKYKGKIAGLEPVNFITSACPHLGSRGHGQVPMFRGLSTLEELAARTSWFLGRTGKHLFLTDGENEEPPLLLQMVNDTDNIKFISALRAFKRRVVYANSSFDHVVGWGTSSLRRQSELPKLEGLAGHDKYQHIVNVEAAKTAPSEIVSEESESRGGNTVDVEEVMLRQLTKLGWERVDVNFSGSRLWFLAHSTIQVKNPLLYSDGADVVQHMIDHFHL